MLDEMLQKDLAMLRHQAESKNALQLQEAETERIELESKNALQLQEAETKRIELESKNALQLQEAETKRIELESKNALQLQEAEAKLALQRLDAETKRMEDKAKVVAAEAKVVYERQQALIREARTNVLAEQSKLHMRGLIELFEKEFSKNGKFKEIVNSSTIKVDRKTKWTIMLELEDYSDLKEELLKDFYDTKAITTQVNALIDNLNRLAHNALKDVLDPSTVASLVINRLSVGDSQAQLLKCIAEKCNIAYMIIG
jgi:hypothetical protein